MPIETSYLDLLKQDLQNGFLSSLPPLINCPVNNGKTAVQKKEKNIARALSAFTLHHLCEVSKEMAAKSVVDDIDDNGIDAILYHGDTVYIVQSKLKETEQFTQKEAQAFCAGIRQLLQLNFSNFNSHFTNRQTDIEDSIENCSKIQILIAHVGSGINQHADDAMKQLLSDDTLDEERLAISYLDIDFQKITQFIKGGNSYPRVNTKIGLECYKSISTPRPSYFGLIDVQDLVTLHDKYEKGLYEKNIRTFLGMGLKQGVNESIQETLKNSPENFCYLNNGVTALCERIEPKNIRNGKKQLQLSGLSIINGAQTISSSAYARDKGTDISKAKVMLTLIKADTDTEFGKAVTKARNHQNPVSLSDFVALEEDQERLRREAAYLGIHYDYKPGSLEQLLDPTRINITEALTALALFHPDPRYAVWLKKEPANLYQTKGTQYQGLFPSNLKVHTLINAVYFYRYIQEQMLIQVAASSGIERLTYKHGNYALAWILSKRLKDHIHATRLLNETELKTAMSLPFDEARNRLSHFTQQQHRGPLAVFRNQTHALPVIQKIMLDDYGLATDPAIPHKQSQYTAQQPYPVALFEYMVSKAPQIEVGS